MSKSRAPYVLAVGVQQVEPEVMRGAEALERMDGGEPLPRSVTRLTSEIELSWWDRLRVLWHGRLTHHVQFMAEAETWARVGVEGDDAGSRRVPLPLEVKRVAVTQSWVAVKPLPFERPPETLSSSCGDAAAREEKGNVDG